MGAKSLADCNKVQRQQKWQTFETGLHLQYVWVMIRGLPKSILPLEKGSAMSISSTMNTDDARKMIREAGLRATPARISVLQLVQSATSPLTHAELVEQLTSNGSDASTIFRALNDMTDAALFRRLDLGDHVWRYEMAMEQNVGILPHPHFLCLDCGEITCLEPVDIRPLTKENRELKKVGKVTEVLLKGSCSNCQED